MSFGRKLLAGLAVPAGLVCGRAYYESKKMLTAASYTVDIADFPRTVQISDLHRRTFGAHQAQLIRLVAGMRPELIVITGDLVSRNMTDFHETGKLLRRLHALAPVLYIPGNHELDLKPMQREDLRRTAVRAGVRVLENETVVFSGIRFAGISLTRAHYRGAGFLHARGLLTCTAKDLRETLGECQPDTVLLAHDPVWFPAYAEWGARLTLSGHVHGGVIRVPGIGGILSPERRFFPKYSKGKYQIGDAEMIVSAGLGKLRLMNPPEICVITSRT
ncbi:MAG: metallophosphoesterase [Oscillospiraceae bacterium]|nr:metallophosphoesterase [Oscillospiraceae bacterium]